MNPDIVYKQLAVDLRSIEDQIRELKQKQFTGTDTVQAYVNQNTSWDIDWTLSSSSESRDFSVLFKADTQTAPVNNMRYIILVDNKFVHKISSFDYHPTPLDVAVLGYVHDTFLSYADLQPTPGLDGWYFNVTGYRSGMNIKVKFIVDSTDTGTVSLMEI